MKAVYSFSVLSALIFSFLLLPGENATAQAPAFEWAKRMGGTGIDISRGIAVDGSGNSYITGSFEGSATFGNTTLTSSGNVEVFIAKYDASGNVLWAQSAGGTGSEAAFAITADISGNSYITGSFEGSATFGSTTLTSSGGMDVFIAKYDASGNALWAQKAGGAAEDVGRAISVDNNGNSYITGTFEGSATFGSTAYLSSGATDMFIARYDASGNMLWAHAAGGADVDSGLGIAADGNGNTYVTGYFKDMIAFGSNLLTSSGGFDVFIAKLDFSGNALWAQHVGGTSDDIAFGIAIDDSGNNYIAGHYRDSAFFGNTILTSIGNADLFVAKHDASGNAIWAKKAGGTTDDSGRAIAVDGSGNSYVTGYFDGSATFGSTTLTSSGFTDVFITKFDAAGNALWARRAGGTAVDFGLGIGVESGGNTYVAGFFDGSATFGSALLNSGGNREMFLAKLSTITGLPEDPLASIPAFPNPFVSSFQIPLLHAGPATVTLTDLLGRQVHRQTLVPETENAQATISPTQILPSGLYMLQIQQGKEIWQARVLKQ